MLKFSLLKNLASKPLVKGLVLISLRETYLFLRNLYGLAVHPSKTTVGILGKPDWSQTILIFGLPGYLWLAALIGFMPVFWLFHNWYGARILLLLSFYFLSFFLFLLGCYLLFWASQYFFRCKLKLRKS